MPDGTRVPKDDIRLEILGTMDEANAALGLAASFCEGNFQAWMRDAQAMLFDLASELFTGKVQSEICMIHTKELDEQISEAESQLPPLKNFILPGGGNAAAAVHLARATLRRAERRIVSLSRHEDIPAGILSCINRVSDLLFLQARQMNSSSGIEDKLWKKREEPSAGDEGEATDRERE